MIKVSSKVRGSHSRCSIKNAVLKNFAKFTGKHLCWSLLLIKLQNFWSAASLKKTPTPCFPVNIAKFLRKTFVKNICERLLLKVWFFNAKVIKTFLFGWWYIFNFQRGTGFVFNNYSSNWPYRAHLSRSWKHFSNGWMVNIIITIKTIILLGLFVMQQTGELPWHIMSQQAKGINQY